MCISLYCSGSLKMLRQCEREKNMLVNAHDYI